MTRVWLSYLENGSRDVSELYQLKLQQFEQELFDAETQLTPGHALTDAETAARRKILIATDPDELAAKEEFARRLRDAFDYDAEATTANVSTRLRVPPEQLKAWLDGSAFPRSAQRRELAKILNVNLEWLEKGIGAPAWQAQEEIEGAHPVRTVPVISWSHAGAAATYEEMPRHFHGSVATTSRDRKAFALTVEGDSMEPKFFTGDRVVLEPSSEARNGKPVVAKFKEDESVQLRIYTKLPSGKIRLAPYNPIYPTIEHDQAEFAWIFPVRELVRSV